MGNRSIQFMAFITLIFCIGCDDDNESFKENLALKASLEGKWKRVVETGLSILINEVIFTEDSVSWYDSAVNIYEPENGEIQTVRGSCPVRYTFNDGIQHYNPYNTTHVYSFSGTADNNILWVFITHGPPSIVVEYDVTAGGISFRKKWQTVSFESYMTSCFVRFRNNKNTAEFWHPLADIPLIYEKQL